MSRSEAEKKVVRDLADGFYVMVETKDSPEYHEFGVEVGTLQFATFWAPILGPSATLMMTNLTQFVTGYRFEFDDIAKMHGLGKTGYATPTRNNPAMRALIRANRYLAGVETKAELLIIPSMVWLPGSHHREAHWTPQIHDVYSHWLGVRAQAQRVD